jgi:hypothetical protein
MKIAFQNENVTLWHGDCLAVLPSVSGLPVCVTDPPFGISDAPLMIQGCTGQRRGESNTWHPPSDWDKAINPEWCKAVCAASDVVAWMGNWRKRGEVEAAMPHKLRCEIVWAKNCHVGPPCPVAMQDERIWLFSRNGIKPREFATTVWQVPIIPTWAHRWHKNEKPVALMARAVHLLTDEGDTVLDPFCGSGTTLIAALETGRKAIGIEIDERWVTVARQRLERWHAQGRLDFGTANAEGESRAASARTLHPLVGRSESEDLK